MAGSSVSQPWTGEVSVGRNLGINSIKREFQSLGTDEMTQGGHR